MSTPASPVSAAPQQRSRSADPSAPGQESCAANNIGPGERRKRLLVGVLGLTACTLVAAALIVDGAPRPWRLILAVPWWTACLGIFQARSHVCVALAARGLQNLAGQQAPQPPAELRAVRREARRVHFKSLAAALLLTLISIAWP